MAARLNALYKEKIVKLMMKKFGYSSEMQVPKLLKITLNMGVGEAVADKKVMNFALDDMQRISGQKPITTLARKSIAGFKIREGWPVGCKVTLRRHKMYEFLDRLINIALPRVRDFRGLSSKAFDGTGNYSLGIQEQIVFPEIDFDKTDTVRGLDICITTSARTNEEAKALLEAFNLPLKDRELIER
jgi:large subunit ribosomal protein L5